MPDTIHAKDESTYQLAPEGEYRAVCVDVIDMGLVESQKWGWQHKIAIIFQTEDVSQTTGKPYELAERFTLSMNEKSRLRQFLSHWRGKPYTQAEAKHGIELHKMVDVPAVISIVHNDVGEKTFANIFTIAKLPKGSPAVKSASYERAPYWAQKKAEQKAPHPTGTKSTAAGPGLDQSQEEFADMDEVVLDDDDLPF